MALCRPYLSNSFTAHDVWPLAGRVIGPRLPLPFAWVMETGGPWWGRPWFWGIWLWWRVGGCQAVILSGVCGARISFCGPVQRAWAKPRTDRMIISPAPMKATSAAQAAMTPICQKA